jgi:tetratricopeptide (TPR) repeat protein
MSSRWDDLARRRRVFDAEQRIVAARHRPLVNALASLRPGSKMYTRTAVLLLLCQVLEGQRSRDQLDDARPLLAEVTPKLERDLLSAMLSALAASLVVDAATLRVFEAYADYARADGRYEIANHVYRMIVDRLPRVGESVRLASIYLNMTTCRRALSNNDAAWAACQAGLLAEQLHRSPAARISLLIAHAKVQEAERRYPEAEEALKEALTAADQLSDNLLAARAAHDWAVTIDEEARATRNPARLTEVLTLLQRAWQSSSDAHWRMRILNDVGRAFASMGLYDAARIAFRYVYASAREKDARWVAAINLQDLSILMNRPDLFDEMREALAGQRMPDHLRAAQAASVAEGCLHFGYTSEMAAALKRAQRIARRINYDTVLEDVASLAQGIMPYRPTPPTVVPPDILQFARSIVIMYATTATPRLPRGRRRRNS